MLFLFYVPPVCTILVAARFRLLQGVLLLTLTINKRVAFDTNDGNRSQNETPCLSASALTSHLASPHLTDPSTPLTILTHLTNQCVFLFALTLSEE